MSIEHRHRRDLPRDAAALDVFTSEGGRQPSDSPPGEQVADTSGLDDAVSSSRHIHREPEGARVQDAGV